MTGMETDLTLVKRIGRSAFAIAIVGVALPFACGFALGEFLPGSLLPNPDLRFVAALFLGTALSISSVKIVALVIRDLDMIRRDIGQTILASAIIEDTIGWIIVALIFGVATQASIDLFLVARSLVGTILFLVFSLTVGRRLVYLLVRWVSDNLASEFALITVALIFMGAMALTTHLIGVHTVLGAFVAGLLVGSSPIRARHVDEQLRGVVTAMFMPLFFGSAGLSANLSVLGDLRLTLLTIGLVLVASVGKFSGAFVGGKIAGVTTREALALGCAMNARGSTEIVVASIGLSLGLLSHDLFTMILAMAVVTTMAMPPSLRWMLRGVPMTRSESARLKREAVDEKSFIGNLERLLLAADNGANGQFASRLAGVIAGTLGMPATVLELRPADGARGKRKGGDCPGDVIERVETTVASAAKTAAERGSSGEQRPAPEIIARGRNKSAPRVVEDETRKGHDLLVIGLDDAWHPDGGFSRTAADLAAPFDGGLIVVVGCEDHVDALAGNGLKILVTVDGSHTARNAAEAAFVLAGSMSATVTAVHVAPSRNGRTAPPKTTGADRKAMAADLDSLARRYGARAKLLTRSDRDVAAGIVRAVEDGEFDLLVMGVRRRAGKTLHFGDTAAAVLEHSDCPVALVAEVTRAT
jgi:Kef-type K+ transport system membrane component KefB/nucleotide-binding universal stress UspA family protein